jgi:hypothetical protein
MLDLRGATRFARHISPPQNAAMNDIPTLIDVSWMIRGLGYGVVLGTAIQNGCRFRRPCSPACCW